MQREMDAKDARIKKLESVRLTKTQCDALKRMKEERLRALKRVKELEKDVKVLRESPNQSSDEQVQGLAKSNKALAEKLDKYAKHTQKLEAEKGAVLHTLSQTEGFEAEGEDFTGSIALLCERLSAAEEECEALASAETRASTYLTQLDRAKEELEKSSASSEVLKEKIEKLTKREGELAAQLNDAENSNAAMQREKEEFMATAEKREDEESDYQKKIRFLESENLSLIQENKKAKRALQTSSAELKAYKAAKPALQDVDMNVQRDNSLQAVKVLSAGGEKTGEEGKEECKQS